jgi:hypothetical protein
VAGRPREDSQDRWFAHYLGLQLSDLQRFEPLRDKLPCIDRRGDGVLTYRFGFLADGKTGMWLLVFYDTAVFFVTHSSSNTVFEGIETHP